MRWLRRFIGILLFIQSIVSLIDLPSQIQKWQEIFEWLGIYVPSQLMDYLVPITLILALVLGLVLLVWEPVGRFVQLALRREGSYFQRYGNLIFKVYLSKGKVTHLDSHPYCDCSWRKYQFVDQPNRQRFEPHKFACPACGKQFQISENDLVLARHKAESLAKAKHH